jgi:predicted site-specific integrase-resolvase
MCGVHRATVGTWLRTGRIRAQARTPSGRFRFTPEGAAAIARRMAANAAAVANAAA